jgi:histidine triad (HIT) family protein
MDNECLFCRIRDRKSPAAVVYEDRTALAFLDIAPRSPGHVLVIPKLHAETLLDLPETDLSPLFRTVQKVADRLMRVLHADGLTIGINQGEVSGQVVRHLHVHIMPRFKGDGGGAVQSIVHNPPAATIAELQQLLAIPTPRQ